MMSKKMSRYDRVFGILLGMFLLAFAISGKVGIWGWVVALVMLLTATPARCPMYSLLWATSRASRRPEPAREGPERPERLAKGERRFHAARGHTSRRPSAVR